MDENYRKKAGSKLTATESKLWLPPLSPKDQKNREKKLDRLKGRKKAKQNLIVVGISALFVVGVVALIRTWQWGWYMFQLNGSLLDLSEPILIGILLLILLIRVGSTVQWTGFSGKTLWSWIKLLFQIIAAVAIPISIIVGVLQFNEQQRNNAVQALDQQQQTTLETYLDHMSDLLLNNKLVDSKVGDEVRSVARARTLTALQNLNSTRKGILLQFLYESRLIQSPQSTDKVKNPIIDLANADLSYTDLRFANLSGADLRGANLSYATLRGDNLHGANLSDTNLLAADLSTEVLPGGIIPETDLTNADLTNADLRATLSGADLRGATLSGADLRGADLSDADLSGDDLHNDFMGYSTLSYASLSGAKLKGADLHFANLSSADLSSTDLRRASLWNADLSSADLSGADLSSADLSDATLKGTVLDGATLNGANLSDAILKGAKYNVQAMQKKDLDGNPVTDKQGKPIILNPTYWNPGFNPISAGAICGDC